MSWRCELFESREAIRAQFGFVPVGAMWRAPLIADGAQFTDDEIAERHRREQQIRAPLWVKLPDGSEFNVYARAYDHAKGGHYGDGWTVTGEAPAITVNPSINVVGYYHGWLQNGVISDDCEGRTFPNAKGLQ